MYTPNYYKPTEVDGSLVIPEWCYQDTPIEIDEVHDGFYVRHLQKEARLSIDAAKYRNIRKTSYFACRWYPELTKEGVPVIESVLIRSSLYDIRNDLVDAFSEFPEYCFVRLCGSSPKDVVELPIFSDPNKAADAIMRSQRTLNIMKNYDHAHLLLRKEVTLENECRCIVHDRKLRAVSVYTWIPEQDRKALEASVLEFFERYADKLPYNSSVLELGWEPPEEPHPSVYQDPFIIEFNSFGIDGFAGASLFDWKKETKLLYHSHEAEFRYPDEFSW